MAGFYFDLFGVKTELKTSPYPIKKSGIKWPSISARDTGERFEKHIPIFKTKEEFKVMGVVYSPDETDSQGDSASAAEIEKAAYNFLQGKQNFKINHKGRTAAKILESYIAPTDLTIAGQTIKKGSWVIAIRILNKKVWKAVKDGILTGFSMGGRAVCAD